MNQSTTSDSPQFRFALAIEYDGACFSGWQRQQAPVVNTVQEVLESAISQVADQPISTTCAGRTDTGVHATCQVIHFESPIDRGEKAWTQGVNSLLPKSIRVVWSKPVDSEFHARFSATARRYVYLMHCAKSASAIMAGKLCHVRQELDVEAMHTAAQYLLGEQDFTAFRAAGCQSKTPMRNVLHANVMRRGELCILDIKANAFLQHMVRNITGALLAIGRGEQKAQWIEQLLQARDRTQAGITAVPDGLYLIQVDYPESFNLPGTCRLPLVLGSGHES